MGDVGYSSPKLVNVCEELHDDEVILLTNGGIGTWTIEAWRAMMRLKKL